MKKNYREYLIADGYNIINAWDSLKTVAQVNMEEAREKLNITLEEYASFRGIFVVVVYDAYNVKERPNTKAKDYKNIQVVYSKEKQTADSYIEKLITDLGARKHLQVSVATDDMAEQQIALGKGVSRIPTRELYFDVTAAQEKIDARTKESLKQKNTLDDILSEHVLERLQKIRKEK